MRSKHLEDFAHTLYLGNGGLLVHVCDETHHLHKLILTLRAHQFLPLLKTSTRFLWERERESESIKGSTINDIVNCPTFPVFGKKQQEKQKIKKDEVWTRESEG